MRRQDVSGFDYEDSGQVIDYMDAGLGPHLRTHLPQIVPPALRLTIGSREFTLDADRDPGVSRIMLVERDLLVRAALAALISTWKGVHVVVEVRTLKEALAQRHMSPDVVVVSLGRVVESAIITDLSVAYGPDRLVVLLGQDAEDFRFEIGRHSHRVLMKSAPPHKLKKAIEGIPVRPR